MYVQYDVFCDLQNLSSQGKPIDALDGTLLFSMYSKSDKQICSRRMKLNSINSRSVLNKVVAAKGESLVVDQVIVEFA